MAGPMYYALALGAMTFLLDEALDTDTTQFVFHGPAYTKILAGLAHGDPGMASKSFGSTIPIASEWLQNVDKFGTLYGTSRTMIPDAAMKTAETIEGPKDAKWGGSRVRFQMGLPMPSVTERQQVIRDRARERRQKSARSKDLRKLGLD